MVVQHNMDLDFATSISIISDKTDQMIERLSSGQVSVVAKLSHVEIKRGKGAKKNWSTGQCR